MTTSLAKADQQKALSKYNPEKGLKTIAAAEAAEKHYARAKDAKQLEHAIRAKLEAQAEFVWWWDTQAKKAEGGDKRSDHRDRSDTVIAGRSGLPDRKTISRWRARLNDPDIFEHTYTAALARYRKYLEFEQSTAQEHNSGEQEWYTPAAFVEAARTVMGGIDLDPATSDSANRIVQAAEMFTADDDGLEQPWHGRVWMNPPYAQPLIARFCEKLAASVRAGTVTQACVLVNNATETQWFRAVVDVAGAICFPTGRVRFWRPGQESAAPLQGQAVIYSGAQLDAFASAFGSFGFVVTVRR